MRLRGLFPYRDFAGLDNLDIGKETIYSNRMSAERLLDCGSGIDLYLSEQTINGSWSSPERFRHDVREGVSRGVFRYSVSFYFSG